VRRFVFAPRWVFGHVLVLAAIASCLLLGDWQWGRAEVTHSLQNMAYALQWPLFAVFFAVSWWRMLRLESRRLDEEAADPVVDSESDRVADSESDADPAQPSRASQPEPAQPGQPEPAGPVVARQAPVRSDEDDDPELAAYNRMLAELAARDQEAEAARDQAAEASRRR
jgi:DNA-binding transcriptional regulator of glucitol operon